MTAGTTPNGSMDPELVRLGESIARGERAIRAAGVSEAEATGPLIPFAVDWVQGFAAVGILDARAQIVRRVTQEWRYADRGWQCLGGSSGYPHPGVPDPAGDRAVPALSADGSRGGSLVSSGFWPWSGSYLMHAWLVATPVTKRVEVLGKNHRIIQVPWHGSVLIAWVAPQGIRSVGRRGLHAGPRDRLPTLRALH